MSYYDEELVHVFLLFPVVQLASLFSLKPADRAFKEGGANKDCMT